MLLKPCFLCFSQILVSILVNKRETEETNKMKLLAPLESFLSVFVSLCFPFLRAPYFPNLYNIVCKNKSGRLQRVRIFCGGVAV
ncbi:hypothetical protein M087_4209 [Bacteroides fragilis str. S23 R14]|nr:hypothetical protein M087_4209 [Bacteroides fragilis str. S23 R14]EYA64252.1 hypothetical protein M139_4485 [Bacteroides fragilis str. S23L24]EYE41556.1 hypothetical protein M138_4444 [Bacteroides fragilis str. S23L17]